MANFHKFKELNTSLILTLPKRKTRKPKNRNITNFAIAEFVDFWNKSNKIDNMSLIEKILINIANAHERSIHYRGMRVNLFGLPAFKNYSPNSVKTIFYRMHGSGLIEKSDKGWLITKAGKRYMKKKADSLLNFAFNFPKNSPKNLIVMFDIPELKKAEREWFRWHLKKFNYVMIQKSVWVGPSPLPREFMEYVEKIKLKDAIKTFKLAKAYAFDK